MLFIVAAYPQFKLNGLRTTGPRFILEKDVLGKVEILQGIINGQIYAREE